MTITKQDLIDEGCDSKHVDDWFTIRQVKKQPKPTEEAIKRLVAQGVKAGFDLPQTIAICVIEGWAGFNHKWAGKHEDDWPKRLIERQQPVITNMTDEQTRTHNKQAVRDSLRNIQNTDW